MPPGKEGGAIKSGGPLRQIVRTGPVWLCCKALYSRGHQSINARSAWAPTRHRSRESSGIRDPLIMYVLHLVKFFGSSSSTLGPTFLSLSRLERFVRTNISPSFSGRVIVRIDLPAVPFSVNKMKNGVPFLPRIISKILRYWWSCFDQRMYRYPWPAIRRARFSLQ